MREKLSFEHLKGSGIEIGALHCPTPLAPGVKVEYVDRADCRENHSDVEVKVQFVVDDAEVLNRYADGSQDFLIANHVLEHLENPIKAMKAWTRVVKPGGILFVALPEATQTFDRVRPVTSFGHLFRDFNEGPDLSLTDHYRDWFSNIEHLAGDDLEARCAAAASVRQNIHFHVWDRAAMKSFFFMMRYFCQLNVLESADNGAEVIWILRKD